MTNIAINIAAFGAGFYLVSTVIALYRLNRKVRKLEKYYEKVDYLADLQVRALDASINLTKALQRHGGSND